MQHSNQGDKPSRQPSLQLQLFNQQKLNLPDAHFGTIKNHVGQNCTIGRQIQKLGILVFVFV